MHCIGSRVEPQRITQAAQAAQALVNALPHESAVLLECMRARQQVVQLLDIAQQRLAGARQVHGRNRNAGKQLEPSIARRAGRQLGLTFPVRGVLDEHLGRRQPLLDVGRAPGRVALAHGLIER